MEVLITAGGTREDIDSVRYIANKSTGRLGGIIAEVFSEAGANITYVCGEGAVLPVCECVEIIRIRSVAELIETVETLLNKSFYDCVIHSMAVSDFTPKAIAITKQIEDELAEAFSQLLQQDNVSNTDISNNIRGVMDRCKNPLTDKKLSSNTEDTALLLKQTPKVIKRIKQIQPGTVLTGFKLLNNVTEEELIGAGFHLLTQNACDFVVCNDLSNINNDAHKAFLLDKSGTLIKRGNTKQEIAQMIFECVSERIKSL